MPEGHSLHRLARGLHRSFAGHEVASSSPQGRFDAGAQILDGRVLEQAEAYGKHLFVSFEGDQVVHVHLGLYGTMPTREDARARAARRRPLAARERRLVRRPPRADGLRPGRTRRARRRSRPARARPPARATPTRARRQGAITAAARPVGGAAHGPGGAVRRRQHLPRRAALPPRRLAVPRGPRCCGRRSFDAMWDDLVVLMKDGVRRGRIVTRRPRRRRRARRPRRRPAGAPTTPSSTAARTPRRAGDCAAAPASTSTAATAGPACAAAADPRGRTFQGRRLFWCPGCQRLPGQRRPRVKRSTT